MRETKNNERTSTESLRVLEWTERLKYTVQSLYKTPPYNMDFRYMVTVILWLQNILP